MVCVSSDHTGFLHRQPKSVAQEKYERCAKELTRADRATIALSDGTIVGTSLDCSRNRDRDFRPDIKANCPLPG
jgi:hypothetical protein